MFKIRAPESYSWQNVEVPIKNQGRCGSCWAFAATASVEYRYKKFYNKFYSLSEQELVDCETTSYGCIGGFSDFALRYIRDKGVSLAQKYPYIVRDGICNANAWNKSPVKIKNVYDIYFSESQYKDYFFQEGPLIIYYYVDNTFYRYKSGIYRSSTCNPNKWRINHAVLLIGYGTENNVKYWLMRNSWGSRFGESGYFRIERDVNMCNLGYFAYYPEVIQTSFRN